MYDICLEKAIFSWHQVIDLYSLTIQFKMKLNCYRGLVTKIILLFIPTNNVGKTLSTKRIWRLECVFLARNGIRESKVILLVQVFEEKKYFKIIPSKLGTWVTFIFSSFIKRGKQGRKFNSPRQTEQGTCLHVYAQKVHRAMTGSYGQDNAFAGNVISSSLCGNTLNWMDLEVFAVWRTLC